MDIQMYREMKQVEYQHWWFVARRSILEKVIKKLNLPDNAEIFEAGCGTGGNLSMLSHYGKVYGMELDDTARSYAEELQIGEIESGRLPDDIPFLDRKFDLIVLLDVLEHLDEDTASLQALSAKLKPSGWFLMTVPAYPWLWSKQDELLHHKRRYVLKDILRMFRSLSYEVRFVSYFNFVLFPPIALIRFIKNLLNQGGNEQAIPAKPINDILTFLFGIERYIVGRLFIPFGVSIILLAQNSED